MMSGYASQEDEENGDNEGDQEEHECCTACCTWEAPANCCLKWTGCLVLLAVLLFFAVWFVHIQLVNAFAERWAPYGDAIFLK